MQQKVKAIGYGCMLVLAAVLLVLTNYVKQTKKLHPIVFICISAVMGIVFHFGGV